ncbi:MAG: hypothetical protein IKQ91_06020 [Oscillospiraceae bacterium]|nr:hypothetical protein [Oscillospiraceae bacterium]
MKPDDVLETMGEISEKYIADTAEHLGRSPRRFLAQLAKPAGIAAAAGLVGFTVFIAGGVIRDGIAQQNPPEQSNTAAHQPEQTEPLTTGTGQPESTLPPDLFEELPADTAAPETTATDVTTTEPVIPPALQDFYDDDGNIIYPDASWDQKIGSTFSYNYTGDGIMAMTVNNAVIYESFADSGIAYEDLCETFLNYYITSSGYRSTHDDSGDWEGQAYYVAPYKTYVGTTQVLNKAQIQADYADYRFVKVSLTLQNINAKSPYPEIERVYFSNDVNGYYTETHMDTNEGIGDCYDFSAHDLYIGVLPNPEHESEQKVWQDWQQYICYFSRKGELYEPDALGRDSWFHLEPGECITFEVGGFVPKTAQHDMLFYEPGTDLKPYYFFGRGVFFPHVRLSSDNQ